MAKADSALPAAPTRPASLLFAGAWLLGGVALMKSGAFWLGAGSLGQGLQELLGVKRGQRQVRLLPGGVDSPGTTGTGLGESLAEAVGRASWGRKTKVTRHYVRNIDERVALIRDLLRKSAQESTVRDRAHAIVSRKCGAPGEEYWCTREKDPEAEADAIFWAFKDPRSPLAVRYVRDHVAIDQFDSAEKILRTKASDCDGMVVLLGSHLVSIGIPVKLRTYWLKGGHDWAHISLLAGLGPTGAPKRWKVFDLTVSKPPGWEVPAVAVKQIKDFDVPAL